jgi:hypothetical protein
MRVNCLEILNSNAISLQNETPFSNTLLDFQSPMAKQVAKASEETEREGGILEWWVLFVVMGIFFAIDVYLSLTSGSKW